MLIADGGYLKLYPWKVRYRQHGQEIEQWALPDKEWWIDFAVKWDHTEILEFIEVELNEEQQARAEEIEELRIDEGFKEICIEYILNGVFPAGVAHPLRQLQIMKEQTEQDAYLIDQDFRLSLIELGVDL